MYRKTQRSRENDIGLTDHRRLLHSCPCQCGHGTSVFAGFLLLLLTGFVPAFAILVSASPETRPAGAYPVSRPALESLPAKVAQDIAKFKNGDKLTGTIRAIREDRLSLSLDLVGETARFPLDSLSELSFAGPPEQSSELCDAIYFRDGSYVSARVTGLTGDELKAVTPVGQAIVVPKNRVAGIGFHHPGDVLFESHFESRDKMGVIAALGSWDVEKGRLVQASPLPFCRAYVKVAQAGVVRYEWTADLSKSTVAGLAFCASSYDTRFGDLAYMAIVRGRQIILYKVIGEARHQCDRGMIKVSGPMVAFRIDYDPRSGEITLYVGKNAIMRLKDSDPILRGDYVVLHTEGKAAFDDLKVTHLAGGIQGIIPHPDLDTVLLSNGDRVAGHVVQISQEVVLKNDYSPAEVPVPRHKVRSILFATSPEESAAGNVPVPEISLWNGDVIFGEVLAMDGEAAAVAPRFAPELVVARADLRAVTFPRASSSAPAADSGPANLLLTIDLGPADDEAQPEIRGDQP